MALATLTNSPISVAEDVLERCGLAITEGKSVQLSYGLHLIRQQLEEIFRSAQKGAVSEEELKQAEHKFIEFLVGESL